VILHNVYAVGMSISLVTVLVVLGIIALIVFIVRGR
jgi:hypothetical protein